ncbi:caspase family protein [Magnetovibrio sp. PR-2]|uniref:caspase family protein n=1 Tax=Magnetovibrio sp. PR-2 TaxID=3120356 RepID=UPI002FCDE7B0
MIQPLRTLLSLTLALCATPAVAETAAVIIGNSTYGTNLPTVEYAERDADAIRTYLIDVMKVDPDNIIDLRNATKAQMETALGTATNPKGKLWHYAGSKKDDEVFVYYSGHGVSGLNDQRQYLLPADALPDFAELNGYPLSTLYNNLKGFKRATVVIDSCFSGSSAGGTLFPSSSGGVIVPLSEEVDDSLTVLTAAGSNQLASWDHDAKQGLFTEYFLRGVYGEADANTDGVVWADELKAYLDKTMSKAARRHFGREQNVSLSGNFDRVFASYPPGNMPVRPKTIVEDKKPEPPKTQVATVEPKAVAPQVDEPYETVEPAPALLVTRRYGVAMRNAKVFEHPKKGTEILTFVRKDHSLMLTGRTKNGKWYETDTNGIIGFIRRANVALLEAGELARWRAASTTGRLANYRAYLRHHPDGYFAQRAERFIERNTVVKQDDSINIYRAPPPRPNNKRPPPPRRDKPLFPRR